MNKQNLTKTFKIVTIYFFLSISPAIFSQTVGVNTPNPFGVFHVDGKGDNNKKGNATPSQQANDFIVTQNGDVGIGTANPTNKLHIKANSDPVKIEGLKEGNFYVNSILVVDDKNVIKKANTFEKLSIPSPTILRLENNVTNFLQFQTIGGQEAIPMKIIKNTIAGLNYNPQTQIITFPKGTYQISFIYEAIHNAPNCSLSSYFIDFPLDRGNTRIHSTASHSLGQLSNHGGTITYATTIPQGRNWQIRLGRGQSGDCRGAGMTLQRLSTQVIIFRLGD